MNNLTSQRGSLSKSRDRMVTVVQGQYKISRDPDVVFSTVLGSCVAACIFDAKVGIGGMNHFLLPGEDRENSMELKYGSMAMELLINDLLKAGAQRSALQAKLFGGARISAGLSNIGSKNVAFARDYVQRENFPIVSESLGGVQARRIHFRPATGHARMMLVAPTHAPQERPAPSAKPQADVTLF